MKQISLWAAWTAGGHCAAPFLPQTAERSGSGAFDVSQTFSVAEEDSKIREELHKNIKVFLFL